MWLASPARINPGAGPPSTPEFNLATSTPALTRPTSRTTPARGSHRWLHPSHPCMAWGGPGTRAWASEGTGAGPARGQTPPLPAPTLDLPSFPRPPASLQPPMASTPPSSPHPPTAAAVSPSPSPPGPLPQAVLRLLPKTTRGGLAGRKARAPLQHPQHSPCRRPRRYPHHPVHPCEHQCELWRNDGVPEPPEEQETGPACGTSEGG